MRFRRLSSLVAVVSLLVAASCGSDSGSEGGTAAGPADRSEVAEAVASFEEHAQRPTEIPISEPLDADITAGREVYWLQCSIPACTQLGEVLKEATDAVDWTLKIIDAGITPETVKAAWAVAARDQPDFVIASGFPHAIYQNEIDSLLAAGKTVVNIDITEEPLDGEYIVQGKEDFERVGAAQADVAVAKSGEGGHILYVTTSTFENEVVRSGSFRDRVAETCASCDVKIIDAPGADIGTPNLAPKITSALRQDPDINVVMLGIGDMAVGLTAAMRAEGIDQQAEVILSDINPGLREDLLNDGSPIAVSTMMEAADMMWQSIDLLLRHDAGKPTEPSLPPALIWHVTPETAADFHPPFNIVEDFQAQYKALWGVS